MSQKYARRMEQTEQRLNEAVEAGRITEQDREAIDKFCETVKADKKLSTAANYYRYMVLISERMDVPLTEATLAELQEHLEAIKTGRHPDVKDDGVKLRPYQIALRNFYGYNDLGIEKEEIDLDELTGRNLSPDDLLYENDVDRLLEACVSHPRDRAFIALTLATGQRIDAIRTLRLRHIEDNGTTMAMKYNTEEAALKGARGSVPLLWAKEYVRPWYKSHPYKGNPDAPLFCAENNRGRHHRGNADSADPVLSRTLNRALKRRARDAGLEKDVWPHLLRHSAITRMVQAGLTEQQIKQTVGWALDSSQFGTYSNLADELSNDSIREQLGMPTTGEKTWVGRPTLNRCECGDQLPTGTERCPTCQTPLTHSAAEAESAESAKEGVREHYREADDMETVEKLQQLDDLLDDPEVRQLLEERMSDK